MGRNTFYDEFLDRCDAFCLMVRSVAVLGSQNSALLDRDAQILIDFIGRVYGWRRELINGAADFILGDLMKVGLTADYLALASAEMLDETVLENLIFFEIKGNAIEEVNRAEVVIDNVFELNLMQEIRSSMNFRAFHHTYEPRVRFSQIKRKACGGDALYALQMAMMLILGIGCESDIVLAQRILERLLVWREKTAAKILSFLWARENDREAASFYQDVFEWLDSPQPVLEPLPTWPEGAARTVEYCTIISAVQSLIKNAGGKREVDFLFAGLMNCEDIPFAEKLDLIRRYKDGAWLSYYNNHQVKPRIGFLK